VHTIGWKAPTEPERAHDYLWRIHQQVPAAGEVMVFNRSHYEDVLVPPVNGWITPEQTRQRYAHINDFERMLVETGTMICKFMLHISKDEQRLRLQERLDDPAKHWKFAMSDLDARKQWDAYQQAYRRGCCCHRHALGPVDHRAGQLQDPPQPDDRHSHEAGVPRDEAALPDRRTGLVRLEGGVRG
jgi:polyphosphate kinase 2 (PPK2 family)